MQSPPKYNFAPIGSGDKTNRHLRNDPEFVEAFSDYVMGRKKKAYHTCLLVIRDYCEHIKAVVDANHELPKTSVYERPLVGGKKCKKGNKRKKRNQKANGIACEYCGKPNCIAIRAPVEISRWHCLFSFGFAYV